MYYINPYHEMIGLLCQGLGEKEDFSALKPQCSAALNRIIKLNWIKLKKGLFKIEFIFKNLAENQYSVAFKYT